MSETVHDAPCARGEYPEYAHDINDSFPADAEQRVLYCRRCGATVLVKDAVRKTAP